MNISASSLTSTAQAAHDLGLDCRYLDQKSFQKPFFILLAFSLLTGIGFITMKKLQLNAVCKKGMNSFEKFIQGIH